MANYDYDSPLDRFFGDRNIISLLAGIGAGLDPKGVGGALGNATNNYVRMVASQDREKNTEKANNAQTQLLLDAIKSHGFSSKDSPGVTSAVATDNGVKLEITPPTQTNDAITQTPLETTPTAPVLAPPTAAVPGVPTVPIVPTVPTVPNVTTDANKKISISDILPFYSARLG